VTENGVCTFHCPLKDASAHRVFSDRNTCVELTSGRRRFWLLPDMTWSLEQGRMVIQSEAVVCSFFGTSGTTIIKHADARLYLDTVQVVF